MVNICGRDGCSKDASLKCPKCEALGMPPAYFCSQECFKQVWKTHKSVHAPAEARVAREKAYAFPGPLRPAKITPQVTVPDSIVHPDYGKTGIPTSEDAKLHDTSIDIKTSEEMEIMREVCRIARGALDTAGRMVKVGVTPDEIDKAVHEFITGKGAYPSPLNYRGFPKSCCVSVNEIICHGIPNTRPFEEGDIVKVDITAYLKGHHGDCCETYFVGNVDEESRRLVQVAYDAMMEGISCVKPGVFYREVGEHIHKLVARSGMQTVRSYCGHGIGKLFHTSPTVPHYAKNKAIGIMRPGHTFTIEPMVNAGTWRDKLWPDDWTVTTADGRRSAQFEHTLAVTEDGYEILTARTDASPRFDA